MMWSYNPLWLPIGWATFFGMPQSNGPGTAATECAADSRSRKGWRQREDKVDRKVGVCNSLKKSETIFSSLATQP